MAVEFQCPSDIPSRNIHNLINDPKERIWQGPFSFVQATDCQFGMIGSYKMHKEEPTWTKEVELAEQTVKNIHNMNPRPKFLVITGDMLDAYPFMEPPQFYKHSEKLDKELREYQYIAFVQVFEKLDPDIKLICACGNHDVGEHPTKETLQMYYKQFGSDVFEFWTGGIKFVVLNSQFLFSPKSLPEELERQSQFIDNIKDSAAKFIVVFQHIPFFTTDCNEEDMYTNIPKEIRIPVLDRLDEAGVRYVFCGHTHQNYSAKYKNIEIVVTSALGAPMGTTPSGYRIVEVNETGLTHQYIQLKDTTEFDDAENEKNKSDKNKYCCIKCHIVYNGWKIKNYFQISAWIG